MESGEHYIFFRCWCGFVPPFAFDAFDNIPVDEEVDRLLAQACQDWADGHVDELELFIDRQMEASLKSREENVRHAHAGPMPPDPEARRRIMAGIKRDKSAPMPERPTVEELRDMVPAIAWAAGWRFAGHQGGIWFHDADGDRIDPLFLPAQYTMRVADAATGKALIAVMRRKVRLKRSGSVGLRGPIVARLGLVARGSMEPEEQLLAEMQLAESGVPTDVKGEVGAGVSGEFSHRLMKVAGLAVNVMNQTFAEEPYTPPSRRPNAPPPSHTGGDGVDTGERDPAPVSSDEEDSVSLSLPFHLGQTDHEILDFMDKQEGARVKTGDLAANIGRDPKSIAKNLSNLVKVELLDKDGRSGYGRTALARPKSSL